MDARAGSAVQPPLSQAVGYVIVVVVGMIVAGGKYTVQTSFMSELTNTMQS